MAEDIAFALNYTNIFEIDITPNGPARTWAWVGPGIKTITPNANEVTDNTAYYDGEGMSSTDVTGGQLTYDFEGHRLYGDAAQDYISSLAFAYGQSRKTTARMTAANGDLVEGKATLTNIVPGSAAGDANSKSDFKFSVAFNGAPTFTAANKDSLPESVTATPVVVDGADPVKCVPTVMPATASAKCLFAIEDTSVATVDAEGYVTKVSTGETKLMIKCAAKPSVYTQVAVTVE